MSNEPADGAQKTGAMGITGWMAFLVAALSASLLILSWLVVLIVTMSVGGSSLSLTLDRGVIYGETVPFSYSTPLRFEKVSRHDLGFHSRFTNPSFAFAGFSYARPLPMNTILGLPLWLPLVLSTLLVVIRRRRRTPGRCPECRTARAAE